MIEKAQDAFKNFISAVQTARFYPAWHPQAKKSVDKAYEAIAVVFAEDNELVFGFVGEEIAYKKEIFFELSKTMKPMTSFLQKRGIERIVFNRGLSSEELGKFISCLVPSKEDAHRELQELLTLAGVKNITVGKIKAGENAANEEGSGKEADYIHVYEDSLEKANQSVEAMLNGEDVDHLALRINMGMVMESLLGRHQEFLYLPTIKRYDEKTFSHVVNVAILAMYFAAKIGLSRENTIDIGTAGLLHDLGKLYISRKIIKKPSFLNEDELGKIKSHAVLGSEILLKYVDTIGMLPAVVCFEHHLKFDLSGYPKIPIPRKLHLASLMVTICDVYDALSQRREYKNDYPPETIHAIMNREKGTTFEPQLLDKFFKIVGVYPVGTIVLLSDESVAVVREVNEEDIASPKVEIISPQDKKGLLDLRSVKEKYRIKSSLSPFKEGKEYLSACQNTNTNRKIN